MEAQPGDVIEDLAALAGSFGVRVLERRMNLEKPGEFDGPTITLNPFHDREALGFYLAHSLGSIYQWSTDYGRARKVFGDLREARESRKSTDERRESGGDSRGSKDERFERAVTRWRIFEERSSEHAVWALSAAGHPEAVAAYSIFFRADLEAMTIFHRTGQEPPWPEFFREWKRTIAAGERRVEPFDPRRIHRFMPVRIEPQEVVQERGGGEESKK